MIMNILTGRQVKHLNLITKYANRTAQSGQEFSNKLLHKNISKIELKLRNKTAYVQIIFGYELFFLKMF